MSEKKLWGGRFSQKNSSVTEKLSASIDYDSRLYKVDILGSKIHSKMLTKCGIISEDDMRKIHAGLDKIEEEIENGSFKFRYDLEDIHMNIESRLTDLAGEAGKRVHTARSRNDQVATDVRLYLKQECGEIIDLIKELVKSLLSIAENNKDVVLPGYTHLQVAQPVRFSHHILAYCFKFLRDLKRLDAAFDSSDVMPLGSGALAGVNYKTDRNYLKDGLGFASVSLNSMDAVSDRDFVLDFLYFGSVLGTHLSRFCEELILWSSSEYSFIKLSDAVTTGSSIMPQKKNPDLAELIRGKTGRLNGNLVSLLTILKGLPMTYNRDLQEDKEPLFDSVDTVKLSLEGMIEMMKNITINEEKMQNAVYSNYSTATDLADYLVKKGLPFREAHEIIGGIVAYCENNYEDFFKLTLEKLQSFSKYFGEDILNYINPEDSTERKLSQGSTSLKEIDIQIEHIKNTLKI